MDGGESRQESEEDVQAEALEELGDEELIKDQEQTLQPNAPDKVMFVFDTTFYKKVRNSTVTWSLYHSKSVAENSLRGEHV